MAISKGRKSTTSTRKVEKKQALPKPKKTKKVEKVEAPKVVEQPVEVKREEPVVAKVEEVKPVQQKVEVPKVEVPKVEEVKVAVEERPVQEAVQEVIQPVVQEVVQESNNEIRLGSTVLTHTGKLGTVIGFDKKGNFKVRNLANLKKIHLCSKNQISLVR